MAKMPQSKNLKTVSTDSVPTFDELAVTSHFEPDDWKKDDLAWADEQLQQMSVPVLQIQSKANGSEPRAEKSLLASTLEAQKTRTYHKGSRTVSSDSDALATRTICSAPSEIGSRTVSSAPVGTSENDNLYQNEKSSSSFRRAFDPESFAIQEMETRCGDEDSYLAQLAKTACEEDDQNKSTKKKTSSSPRSRSKPSCRTREHSCALSAINDEDSRRSHSPWRTKCSDSSRSRSPRRTKSSDSSGGQSAGPPSKSRRPRRTKSRESNNHRSLTGISFENDRAWKGSSVQSSSRETNKPRTNKSKYSLPNHNSFNDLAFDGHDHVRTTNKPRRKSKNMLSYHSSFADLAYDDFDEMKDIKSIFPGAPTRQKKPPKEVITDVVATVNGVRCNLPFPYTEPKPRQRATSRPMHDGSRGRARPRSTSRGSSRTRSTSRAAASRERSTSRGVGARLRSTSRSSGGTRARSTSRGDRTTSSGIRRTKSRERDAPERDTRGCSSTRAKSANRSFNGEASSGSARRSVRRTKSSDSGRPVDKDGGKSRRPLLRTKTSDGTRPSDDNDSSARRPMRRTKSSGRSKDKDSGTTRRPLQRTQSKEENKRTSSRDPARNKDTAQSTKRRSSDSLVMGASDEDRPSTSRRMPRRTKSSDSGVPVMRHQTRLSPRKNARRKPFTLKAEQEAKRETLQLFKQQMKPYFPPNSPRKRNNTPAKNASPPSRPGLRRRSSFSSTRDMSICDIELDDRNRFPGIMQEQPRRQHDSEMLKSDILIAIQPPNIFTEPSSQAPHARSRSASPGVRSNIRKPLRGRDNPRGKIKVLTAAEWKAKINGPY